MKQKIKKFKYKISISFLIISYSTCKGWVKKHELKADTKNEVNHFAHFSSPNMIPFAIMKNAETPTQKREKT